MVNVDMTAWKRFDILRLVGFQNTLHDVRSGIEGYGRGGTQLWRDPCDLARGQGHILIRISWLGLG